MADQHPKPRVVVPGSERHPVAGAHAVGPVDPNETVEVSIYLRPPANADISQDIQKHAFQPMSRAEYAEQRGARAEDIAKVEQFAREYHLTVVEKDPARRLVKLSGPAQAISAAFETRLHTYDYKGSTFRGRTGALTIPTELADAVTGVFGIDDRPQARPYIQSRATISPIKALAAPHAAVSYTPPELAKLYNFPTQGNGAGQTIAIIELGGGYRDEDVSAYFSKLGLPTPTVVSVSVDGAQNQPGDPSGADGEVALDIDVAGGVAPGAKLVVYFAPNTDAGFLNAITAAVHDSTNNPSVISISWGQAEAGWTQQAMQNMHNAFQDAAALGVTVCAAAGDSGSGDSVGDGRAHVDFPASNPFVLGCGGTNLKGAQGKITSEVVWNDNPNSSATGGGVSDVFDLPEWQKAVHVPPSTNPGARVGRGVPDVAGDASPQTGYEVLLNGQISVFGGTSAVAPLWAGLVALINQQLGKPVGYLNPTLYKLPAQSGLRDITLGNNGKYSARQGWDPCTGLGTPDGAALLTALGAPVTPTPTPDPTPPTHKPGKPGKHKHHPHPHPHNED